MARNNRLAWFLMVLVLLAVSMISGSYCYATTETSLFDPVLLEDLYYKDILLSVNESSYADYDCIKGIDISSQGSLIVVLSSGTTHYVDVYDNNLEFKNQLALYSAGTVFVLFGEDHDKLIMYFPKEKIKVTAGINGKFISATRIEAVPETIIKQYAREASETTIYPFHYSLNTNNLSRSVVVKSVSGEIMCQYHVTINSWGIYLLSFITLTACAYIHISKKTSRGLFR